MSGVSQFTNGNDMSVSEILKRMNNCEKSDSEFLPNPFNSEIKIDPSAKYLADVSGFEIKTGPVSDIFDEIECMLSAGKDSYKGEFASEDMAKFHQMIRENINSKDDTYDLSQKLFRAAGKGDVNLISELVVHPKFLDFVDTEDENGFRAISYALTYGHPHIAKLLINHGAKPDDSSLSNFINLGDVDPNLLKETDEDFSRRIDMIGQDVTSEDLKQLSNDLPIKISNDPAVVSSETLDRIAAIRKSVQDTNNFESSFRRNVKLNGMFGISNALDKTSTEELTANEQIDDEDDEKWEANFDDTISKLDSETTKIPFESKCVKDVSETIEPKASVAVKKKASVAVKKEKGEFGSSFATNMRKNFAKTGFSEGRNSGSDRKIELPHREETTPEQMEDIIKQFEKSQMNESSFAAVNSRFVAEYTNRNVSLLLTQPSNISPEIQEYRNKMLPEILGKDKLFDLVKNVMRKQISSMGKKRIQTCVDEIYEVAIFYRDMFLRLIDLKKAYVKKSNVHGKGVFVSSNLKRGDIITFYFPYFLEYMYEDKENKEEAFTIVPIISRRDFQSNMDELDNLRRGTIKLSDRMMMIGDNEYYGDNRFLGHMVNDPCDFTCEIVTTVEYERQITEKSNAALVTYSKDARFMYLVATKDIPADTEVLVPYGCRYWEIPETSITTTVPIASNDII